MVLEENFLTNQTYVQINLAFFQLYKYQTILNWNHLQSTLNINLSELTLAKLKKVLINHFIGAY